MGEHVIIVAIQVDTLVLGRALLHTVINIAILPDVLKLLVLPPHCVDVLNAVRVHKRDENQS